MSKVTELTPLVQRLAEGTLLLDGATGSLIQNYSDSLCLSHPELIRNAHRSYLEAGADIITTSTFSAQRISSPDADVVAINRAAARIALEEAARMTALTPEQPRFVLGDVGPTNKMLSMSDDVTNPAARAISFDELEAAYLEQIQALAEEGVDGILVETIFDTLNAKAAISAYLKVKEQCARELPIILSMTISDKSGRSLSGQTVEAFVASVMHASPLCVGLNCGLGADSILPCLRRMKAALAAYPGVGISCHPNAGLPDGFGVYSDGPEEMVAKMRPMVEEGIANIIGGCCGTTPKHIELFRKLIDEFGHSNEDQSSCSSNLIISGLESFTYKPEEFVTVGERCNVAGSRKFLRLISEKKYDEAMDIARAQIGKGAQVIDINMDDGLLDARAEMRTFLNLLAGDPSISRVPVMVDSSRFDVIEEGLKCLQGKGIVNSISLKQGEEEFLRQARIVRRLGAAVIVMCFDEQGQATSFERRTEVAARAYRLLTEKAGFAPSDIIFDPNVLTIATGMEEHADYAADFIKATAWIRQNLPGARVSGGLSNLSFAFRGNNPLREAMHSVFLHYAVEAGMGMAIMNPATAVRYDDIDPALRDALAAVILNTAPDAVEKLTDIASSVDPSPACPSKLPLRSIPPTDFVSGPLPFTKPRAATVSPGQPLTDQQENAAQFRIINALISGTAGTLEADLMELINSGQTPLQIISGPLMAGMNEVGRRFGEGTMFLSQVVRTARTMKQAVEVLNPFMSAGQESGGASAGRIVLATVKGDVHDIGKNIVGVVLACNGFEVIDLGVMVPAEEIVRCAAERKADIVCLSGLITPSLEEMCKVAAAMQEAGLKAPLFVGGATTKDVHTAVKIAPLYDGGVFHMTDAAQNPVVAMALMDPERRASVLEENAKAQEALRQEFARKQEELAKRNAAATAVPEELRFKADWSEYQPVEPPFSGQGEPVQFSIDELVPLIDWNYFYWAWKVKPGSDEAERLRREAEELLSQLSGDPEYKVLGIQAFYRAKGTPTHIEICPGEPGGSDPMGSTCPCCGHSHISIDTPRQALIRQDGSQRDRCLAMSDFVCPDGDTIGLFACSAGAQTDNLLLQSVSDRLAEAAAELMSIRLKEKGWGGIRPAIGYPSIPDQKQIFQVARLLDFSKAGITLTENGAMFPQASVCGIYIQHPKAEYFNL